MERERESRREGRNGEEMEGRKAREGKRRARMGGRKGLGRGERGSKRNEEEGQRRRERVARMERRKEIGVESGGEEEGRRGRRDVRRGERGLGEGWGGRKQEAAAIATTKAISPSEEQSPNEGRRGPTPASEASARAQVMREMLSLF